MNKTTTIARTVIRSFCLIGSIGAICTSPAWAAEPAPRPASAYPAGTIKVIVPFAAGGAGDTGTRILVEEMRKVLRTTMIVENRPGASAVIGTNQLAKSAPDGYTIGYNTNTIHAGGLALFKSLPFHPVDDFAPIALVHKSAMVLVVKYDSPVKSVADLLPWFKAHPDSANFSYHNSSTQVAAVTLLKRLGGSATPVPYTSSVGAMTNVAGGSTGFGFVEPAVVLPLIEARRVRAIAISTLQRSALFPDTPTIAESSLPGFDMMSWGGLFAPAGTPQNVVNQLSEAARQALEVPGVREKFLKGGSETDYRDSKAFAQFLQIQTREWTERIREAGIEPQ